MLDKAGWGYSVEVRPSTRDAPSFEILKNVFVPLWSFPKARYAFEIFFDRERLHFTVWANEGNFLKAFTDNLFAVYRDAVFTEPTKSIAAAGEYVASAVVKAKALVPSGEFVADLLSHFYEATSKLEAKSVLQIQFVPSPYREYFYVSIRVSCLSYNWQWAYQTLTAACNSLKVLEKEGMEIKPVRFPIFGNSYTLLKKIASRRWPILFRADLSLLPAAQLASLVHLPTGIRVRVEYVQLTPTPPLILKGGEILIGRVFYKGSELNEVNLSIEDLSRHQYCIGASGAGKTTFLINEILQIFRRGYCVWILDISGDLSHDLLRSLTPEERGRVVFLDALKTGFSINPFEVAPAESTEERDLMRERTIGELAEMVKRMYGPEFFGPSLARLFTNAARLLYSEKEAPTFEDMLNLFTGKLRGEPYETFFKELLRLPVERADSVINKVSPFAKSQILWRLFSQPKSSIDFQKLTQPNQLVVWRLAKGELSEFFAELAGSAVLTKLWFSVTSRGQRTPIFLFLDEFQSYGQLETLWIMLSEARKYGLFLFLAHQTLKQLPERLGHEALANCATKVAFRTSGYDAGILAKAMASEELFEFLPQLPDGICVVKPRAGFGETPISLFAVKTLPKPPQQEFDIAPFLAKMRDLYGARIERRPEEEIGPDLVQLLQTVFDLEVEGVEPSTRTLLVEMRSRRVVSKGSELAQLIDRAQRQGLVERTVVRPARGRPKILLALTVKGRRIVAPTYGLGGAAAGGEMHRAMVFRVAKWLREKKGYMVDIPFQRGQVEMPDILAWEKTAQQYLPIAFECETTGANADQVVRNYWKNFRRNRSVVFVVPSPEVEKRVRSVLEKAGAKGVKVWVFRLYEA